MQIVRRADLTATPWKNGGGVTREIAAVRAGAALLWRLSVADVASDGPFSSFPGLMRILTVIEGNGMLLIGPEATMHAELEQPVRFDGALPIEANLKLGPLRDFNLIFDPAYCDGQVTVLRGPYRQTVQCGSQLRLALHGLQGTVTVNAEQLKAGDTALIDSGPVTITLADSTTALLVSLAVLAKSQSPMQVD